MTDALDISAMHRDMCAVAGRLEDRLTASEAEAADLRRKLEAHQDAEDKAAREMATVIQGLRNRATAAERKLEEARKALEEIRDMPITEPISVYEIAKAAISGASE